MCYGLGVPAGRLAHRLNPTTPHRVTQGIRISKNPVDLDYPAHPVGGVSPLPVGPTRVMMIAWRTSGRRDHGSVRQPMSHSLDDTKNLLLTGFPGCGKTTVMAWVIERLGSLRPAGFLTRELRQHGQRVGFEAVGLGGRRALLAHVRVRSPLSVGRYGVDPDRLLPLIEEELERPRGTVDAFLIDE